MSHRAHCIWLLTAAMAILPALSSAQTDDVKKQIAEHERKVAAAHASGKTVDEAEELNRIGLLYRKSGNAQKALDYYNQSLALEHQLGNRSDEAVLLDNMALAYTDLHKPQKALEFYTQALAIRREIHDRRGEGNMLYALGIVSSDMQQPQKALEFYTQALAIRRELKDSLGEANTLHEIGYTYRDYDQPQKALQFFLQALPLYHSLGNRNKEAEDLHDIGVVYDTTAVSEKALDFLNRALAIRREVGDREGEESTVNAIGSVYWSMGQNQKAFELYNQALAIAREIDDRDGEQSILNNIGAAYGGIGEPQKALEFYNRALAIEHDIEAHGDEGSTWDNIGAVYFDLGDSQKALECFNKALAIARETDDVSSEATALGNIGGMYLKLNEIQKALDYFNQSLPLHQSAGDRRGESVVISHIALAYFRLGQPQKALEKFRIALSIEHETGERISQGYTLARMGTALGSLGDTNTELRDETAALAIARDINDPELEGIVEDNLMDFFRDQKKPGLAILFGTDAVNSYQRIRKNMGGLDKALQSGFTQSKSSTYRELAELLVSDNRLAEAERVLDLLKNAELKETVRGAAGTPDEKTTLVHHSDAEIAGESALTAEASNATSLTEDSFEFDRLSALPSPTDADKAKIKALSDKIATGNTAIQAFFDKTLYEQLGGNTHANARASNADTETSSLSNQLADLGPGTLALYTLIGDQHSYIIVTTATARTRYELHTNATDLGKLVLDLRQELRTSSSDPSKDLATLSHILLDPIAADLAAAAKQSPDGIPTLLWSLDGVLRYVPMNALFDPTLPQNHRYLAERARNVVITPESRNHLLDPPGTTELKAAAFGVSQSYLGLHALNGVPAELDAIVHDPAVAASHGPLQGQLLRDDAFTLTALESTLRQHYPVVHVASHFVFQAGSAGESYLLIGGKEAGDKGYELTMSQLQTDPQLSFHGTRLLTLSACSTAEADTSGNGREIDSLGMVMQKRDAAAVLATLWDVNDASTSLLMSDFYRRWAATGIAKIEALRQAQISMLRGTTAPSPTSTTGRGSKPEAAPTEASTATYAHPYFWAPFVLIGNFR